MEDDFLCCLLSKYDVQKWMGLCREGVGSGGRCRLKCAPTPALGAWKDMLRDEREVPLMILINYDAQGKMWMCRDKNVPLGKSWLRPHQGLKTYVL